MMKETVTINMEQGMEARPIAMLVQVANRYDSSLYIEADDKRVNLKSIMGVMSLTLDNGDEVVVAAEGSDEEQALVGVGSFLRGLES